jgi:acetyl esterase/lipase
MQQITWWHDLVYMARPTGALCLDLYLPVDIGGPLPLVIELPGGGWRNCDKNGVPRFLVEHGFAVAAVNYRLSSVAPAPANLHDCRAALRWLRQHATTYGLDGDRIGVYGASAGGHLAALLGMSAGVAAVAEQPPETDDRVQAVVAVCGPMDLTRIAIPAIREQFGLLYDVTAQYLGGPVTERAALAQRVSPLSYVAHDLPPILLVHGDGDSVVPVAESTLLHEALVASGQASTLRLVPGAGHGWLIDQTQDDVVAFFQLHLA